MANLNPLELKIVDVKIKKFTGNDEMSIMPQFIELTVFQSLFEPVIKAQMLINDNIGMFNNYPFTGEEVVTIYYQSLNSTSDSYSAKNEIHKQFQFIIKGVKDIIINDRARSMIYTVELTSVEFLQNARKYVSHAYNDLFEDAAEKVYNEYILEDTELQFKQVKNFYKEKSIKLRQVVIPNLRPFQAIQWLAKHAVSSDHENKFLYMFYENFDGFNFTTIQQLIKDGQDNIQTLIKNQFKFVSDTEISKINQNDPNQQLRYISNIVNNKRFSSIEKIAGGYYQNELFEISMLQKSYNSTNTELSTSSTGQYTLGPNPLNTPEYIKYVKNKIEGTEYSNRVRYIINNYEDFDSENRSQPDYRLKFGQSTKYLYALNQIDLTITVPANMGLNAGDIIYCLLPESHGFNIINHDKYISGMFIISEVKHVITTGNKAATSLRIYKDGYLNTLYEDSLYNTNAPSRGRKIIDPATGKLTS